jgi:competence protein ComEA
MFKKLLMAVLLFLFLTSAAFAGMDINTAGYKELVSLPGIGPAKAAAIIDYRTSHGSFDSPDDLKKVKGIGAKTVEKVLELITVKVADH